jgi:hypothetical protein
VRLNVNLHIFLCRHGVVCLDFDWHYSLFVHPPRPPNICTNMRGEKDFLALPSCGLSKLEPAPDMIVISRESSPRWSVKSGPKRVLVEGDYSSKIEIVKNYILQLCCHKSGSTGHIQASCC